MKKNENNLQACHNFYKAFMCLDPVNIGHLKIGP